MTTPDRDDEIEKKQESYYVCTCGHRETDHHKVSGKCNNCSCMGGSRMTGKEQNWHKTDYRCACGHLATQHDLYDSGCDKCYDCYKNKYEVMLEGRILEISKVLEKLRVELEYRQDDYLLNILKELED